MTQTVFLVHGMGAYPDDTWKNEIVATLRDEYSKYPQLIIPFDQAFDFVFIKYDEVFEDIRQVWREQAESIEEALGGGAVFSSGGAKMLSAMEEIGKDEFLTTHVLDVVLYRYIPQIASAVRAKVNDQIVQHLKTSPSSNPQWSIIAHSLGTSVISDSLHELYTTEIGLWGDTMPSYANTIVMLSNVSRVLQNDIKVYTSKVKPYPFDSGICSYFVNASHEYDPFIKPNPFLPWETWAPTDRYYDITVSATEEVNVHDASHYLKNPKLSCQIFNLLLGGGSELINADEAIRASERYLLSIGAIRQKQMVAILEKYSKDRNLSPRITTTLTPSIVKVWSRFLSEQFPQIWGKI